MAPVNALLFNSDLTCDYAAPIDDAFLGQPRHQLVGRSAADVLPPAHDGLTPLLRRAAQEGRAWSAPEYRFVDPVEANRVYYWSIHVDPVRVPEYRGVLVTWQDIQRNAGELAALRSELAALRRQAEEREAAALGLYADIRNALTPVWGYLQVIVKRPSMLRERSPADLIGSLVLPALSNLLSVVERLRHPPFSRSNVADGSTGSS